MRLETKEKQVLLSKIEGIEDALLISRINHIVGELETDIQRTTEKLKQYESLIEEITSHSSLVNEPLRTDLEFDSRESKLARFEKSTARAMFWLSFTTLFIGGLLIMYGSEEETFLPKHRIVNELMWLALAIWPLFVIEFLVKLKLGLQEGKSKYLILLHGLCIIFPPSRLAIGSIDKSTLIWLPIANWTKVNPALELFLKKKFLIPILTLGLLMIPALLIEIKFNNQILEAFPRLDLAFYLQTFHAMVWAGFALEFMVLISVTDDKKGYCVKNWMDILILVLPVVSFFRSFRVLRILKFNQLAQSFRLKGSQAKIKEGLVLLDFIKRLGYLYNPELQIKRIKKKMLKNQQEKIELEKEMIEAIEIFMKKKEKKN